MQKSQFERRISATIIQLRLRSPFFATLALFASIRETKTIPTAATDGRNVFINTDFWQTLTAAEQLGVFVHEILHAALLHVPRRGSVRNPVLWNIAADIVVNGMILAQQDFTLPRGLIRDQKLEHLSVEEIYQKLEKDPRRKLTLHLADLLDEPGEDLRDASGRSLSVAELERYWRDALQQARTVNEMLGQGNLPAGLQREMDHLSPAQLDWRSYLWRFLVQTPVDFQHFDRRFVGQGLYLDALAGEKLYIYIAVDTSGSIGRAEISQFLGEVQGILGAYPHLEAQLYYADASCYGPYELSPNSKIPNPVGGGGTDFRPFFATVEARHQPFDNGVYVYFTDGYGPFPAAVPSLPVLWILSSGGINTRDVPFGEAVRLIPDVK